MAVSLEYTGKGLRVVDDGVLTYVSSIEDTGDLERAESAIFAAVKRAGGEREEFDKAINHLAQRLEDGDLENITYDC